jgi:hypothetical protein
MRSTRIPSGLAIAWAGWLATTWGERLAIAFAFIFIAAVAVGALYSSQRTIAHIGQPGWICGATLRSALACQRDPNFKPGQTPEPAR